MGWFGRGRDVGTTRPTAPPPAPAPAPPRSAAASLWGDGFGRVATRSLQTLAVVAVVAVGVLAVMQLTLVVIPVLIALVLAAAINPLVAWLRRRGVPSLLATWIALLTLVALLSLVVWAVVRAVINQWDELADSAVDGLAELRDLVSVLPFEITDEQVTEAQDAVQGLLASDAVGAGAAAGLSQTADFVAGFFIMVVVLFFFLKDGPKIWKFLLRPFEGERYERGVRVGDRTVQTLGGYVRGTAIIAAVDAIGIGIGLAVVGVPLVIPLSVLVFLLAFVPLVGATVAGILAALVALVALGPIQALFVVAIVVVVNQIEGDLLQPVVMGRSLRLHPLVILVALTAGTVLAGITGAVLAVPIAASLWGAVQVWDGPGTPARFARQKRPETV
ncbi:AI-2E family transporter [Cellulomonas xiejunii]|uniref:AI-2E family transporter n=1 Tax=Cellulomonas xiejunii TaxID=2968083 RepID=A0ABY5KR98_9CELL|nr:AI-2E family transporter [Cellulomonas xiejunii]MCC2321384.1 AI-2E family transporter [Cellulomonas xiejunii]UUI71966.1 AI-2E family transporter [Cellulomonas xiejunii]